MSWVFWLVFGLSLLGLEAAFSGVVLVFFGIGALLTALVAVFAGPEVQLAVFSVVSIVLLTVFRKRLRDRLQRTRGTPEAEDPMAHLIGRTALVVAEVAAHGGRGRIEIQGSSWTCASTPETSAPIAAGQSVRIVKHDGIVLTVEALSSDS